ncbi:uncharacterized protein LOC132295621 [Cornus florida]|uniref:uncharacterized protein LOC132295621 n=1 Tax=Cornus florida TaxID=4283 RepID=UPI00289B23A3|nr:uncharacterized protein LOC132295621 [Cornus florida]
MSWIRSAVNKAVEVGGMNSLTRTVRTYADSVVQQAGQAVAEGAKIFQDRIAPRNFQSFKLAVKRLEEVSVSCRGIERIQLLRRWLVALKEIERISGGFLETTGKESQQLHIYDESRDSPRKPTLVLYYDSDLGGEPVNFRDVFLYSQALEGMTLSMILEAPDEEEVSLIMEIFGLCLTGGKEVHNALVSSIQDLSKAFSSYQDEVLVKREELLQYAQGAIAGLKVHAEIARIDSEVSNIHKTLDGIKTRLPPSEGREKSSEESTFATVEALKEALAQIQLCSKLEEILLKKKFLKNGDSPEIHAQKVDKLKILSESLSNSASKAEKRISDHRYQKEEALNFRVTRATEVSQLEKDLAAEIGVLEKRKEELEAELKKVNTSLATARARLRNAREEREQFDNASNEILEHFETKEDELARSVASYRAESDVCNALINFLEDTWGFQISYTEHKEKQISDEWERHEDYFVNLAIHLLSTYKEELGPSVTSMRKLVENLNSSQGSERESGVSDENSQPTNPRRNLEGEYLDSEAKIITTFSIVESLKKQFYTKNGDMSRKVDQRVEELFDSLEKIKNEFESIERPVLEIETTSRRAETPSKERPPKSPSSTSKEAGKEKYVPIGGQSMEIETPPQRAETPFQERLQNTLPPSLKQVAETTEDKKDEFSELPVSKGPSQVTPQNTSSPSIKLITETTEGKKDGFSELPVSKGPSQERPQNTSSPSPKQITKTIEGNKGEFSELPMSKGPSRERPQNISSPSPKQITNITEDKKDEFTELPMIKGLSQERPQDTSSPSPKQITKTTEGKKDEFSNLHVSKGEEGPSQERPQNISSPSPKQIIETTEGQKDEYSELNVSKGEGSSQAQNISSPIPKQTIETTEGKKDEFSEQPVSKGEGPSQERPQNISSPSPKETIETTEGKKDEVSEIPVSKGEGPFLEGPQNTSSPISKQTIETIEGKKDEFSELPVSKGEGSSQERPQNTSSPIFKQISETTEGKKDEFSDFPMSKGPSQERPQNTSSPSHKQISETTIEKKLPVCKEEGTLDLEAEFSKPGSKDEKHSIDYSKEEIECWEFDELEKELKNSDSSNAQENKPKSDELKKELKDGDSSNPREKKPKSDELEKELKESDSSNAQKDKPKLPPGDSNTS